MFLVLLLVLILEICNKIGLRIRKKKKKLKYNKKSKEFSVRLNQKPGERLKLKLLCHRRKNKKFNEQRMLKLKNCKVTNSTKRKILQVLQLCTMKQYHSTQMNFCSTQILQLVTLKPNNLMKLLTRQIFYQRKMRILWDIKNYKR